MTRVLFTGSRTWPTSLGHVVAEEVVKAHDRLNATIVVGDAKQGVDLMVRFQAGVTIRGVPLHDEAYPTDVYAADWRQHGKSAGMIRNTSMVRTLNPETDYCLAFIDNFSSGALHCAFTANLHKVKTYVFDSDPITGYDSGTRRLAVPFEEFWRDAVPEEKKAYLLNFVKQA